QPLLKDLGAGVAATQTTNFGQGLMRFNRVMYDVGVLTRALHNGKGELNTDGSLQRLVTRSDLHDNLNQASVSLGNFFRKADSAVSDLKVFAAKVSRDPGTLMRGALQRQ